MAEMKRRYLVLIVIMAATAIIVNYLSYGSFYKAEAAVETVGKIPLKIGDWVGRDVPLDKRVYDILETKAILNRQYRKGGHTVLLSLVYYPETKVDFHAPEACLSGQGVEVSKSPRTIWVNYHNKRVKVGINQLVRQHNGINELYFYFYKAGDFMGRSYIRLRLNLALNKFRSTNRSGSLIRVSVPVTGGSFKAASSTLTDFVHDLYPYLLRYL